MSKLLQSFTNKEKVILMTNLDYVGLPLALEFTKYFKVIGFDINVVRIKLMKKGTNIPINSIP